MGIKVKLRLPVPEGKPGAIVELSEERAQILVDRKYAVYAGSEAAVTAEATPPPSAAAISKQATPDTELPNHSDNKPIWEEAARSLSISLEREDGTAKTKDELIAEVEAAVKVEDVEEE